MTALIALKPFQIVEELATTPLSPTKTHNTHTQFYFLCFRQEAAAEQPLLLCNYNNFEKQARGNHVHSSNSFPAQFYILKQQMKGSCHGSRLQHGRHGLEKFPLRCTDNMEHQGLGSSPSTLTSDL